MQKPTHPSDNRGKILRIKAGFNPNSSSVGSQIPTFFAVALSSGALTVLVMNLLANYERILRKKRKKDDSVEND